MVDFKDFFRKFGLWIGKSLITILIVLAILTYAASQITNPDFLKPVVQAAIVQQFSSSQIDEAYAGILKDCLGKQQISVPLEQFGKTLTINCTEARSSGKEEFVNKFAATATDSLFGGSYNSNVCEGYDCIALFQNTQDPLKKISALMNANFNRFVANLSTYFIIGVLICALLILLLAEGLPAKLIGLGYPLAVSGIPYFGISLTRDKLMALLPARALVVINGLMDKLSTAFLAMLIFGVVLLVAGFVAKLALNKKAREIESEVKKKK